jgi:mRNA interferase HicA
VKRSELIRYLKQHGCQLLREGKRHSIWHNPRLKQQSTVPRHTEINDITAKAICRDLGVPFPKS